MDVILEELKLWMSRPENEHIEFKEAKSSYEFDDLVKYCAAFANEGGGKMILGVTDKRPRKVVGSSAFGDLGRTKKGLIDRLHLRIEACDLQHSDGRVVVFDIPSRPFGMPIGYKGAYWMRGGQALMPMTPDLLKRIFDEAGPDFSAEICSTARSYDLDGAAIENFRAMWRRRSGNEALDRASDEQLLADAELIVEGRVTYAALILLGTHQALGKHLAQAEVIFEYRSSDASIPSQQRKEYRKGFFLFYDDLWETINLRNDIYHYQDGFFMRDVPTFNEVVVREAILNAISHRDYRLAGSVFVRQFPSKLEIVSPGGFPPGITAENILWRQFPRNRRLAEAFARCGLVERSGQGTNRMFEECIKESKAKPDFSGTDDFQVSLTLRGEVQDPRFLRFLEQIGRETLTSFTTQDFLVLDLVHREQPIPVELRDRLSNLRDRGIIEVQGRGKGTSYLLSHRFYTFIEKKGTYTRRRGLDKETNKALLVRHIRDNRREGSQLSELMQVLPSLSRGQVQRLVQELSVAGLVHSTGRTSAGRWYPGRSPGSTASNSTRDGTV